MLPSAGAISSLPGCFNAPVTQRGLCTSVCVCVCVCVDMCTCLDDMIHIDNVYMNTYTCLGLYIYV